MASETSVYDYIILQVVKQDFGCCQSHFSDDKGQQGAGSTVKIDPRGLGFDPDDILQGLTPICVLTSAGPTPVRFQILLVPSILPHIIFITAAFSVGQRYYLS